MAGGGDGSFTCMKFAGHSQAEILRPLLGLRMTDLRLIPHMPIVCRERAACQAALHGGVSLRGRFYAVASSQQLCLLHHPAVKGGWRCHLPADQLSGTRCLIGFLAALGMTAWGRINRPASYPQCEGRRLRLLPSQKNTPPPWGGEQGGGGVTCQQINRLPTRCLIGFLAALGMTEICGAKPARLHKRCLISYPQCEGRRLRLLPSQKNTPPA